MSNQVPLSEAPVVEPVTLINAFTVPLHESERFYSKSFFSPRLAVCNPGSMVCGQPSSGRFAAFDFSMKPVCSPPRLENRP